MPTSNAATPDELAEISRATGRISETMSRARSEAKPSPGETTRRRFRSVAWEEAPDRGTNTSGPSSDEAASLSSDGADSAGSPVSALVRFERVPWHPSEVDEREEGSSEWNENMKVKNFFDGFG